MKSSGTKNEELARKLSYALISKAAEGLSIASLRHLSEATFQDALIFPCMAHGSQQARVWWAETERFLEVEKRDLKVDLTIMERSTHNKTRSVGAVEVKWWRDGSSSGVNPSSRRKNLLVDIVRVGALSSAVNGFAFLCLVTTKESWNTIIDMNNTADAQLIKKVDSATSISIHGEMRRLAEYPLIRQNNVPIPSSLHVRRLHECSLKLNGTDAVIAKVWEVRKPQRSTWL